MPNTHDLIYDILDLIEELRGEDNLIARIKESCPASDAFIASVVKFEQEIQQIPADKEVTHVKLKGEEEICKVFSIGVRGYVIQASIADAGRGIHERRVPHDRVAERLYEEAKGENA
jgi:hypothetical protein